MVYSDGKNNHMSHFPSYRLSEQYFRGRRYESCDCGFFCVFFVAVLVLSLVVFNSYIHGLSLFWGQLVSSGLFSLFGSLAPITHLCSLFSAAIILISSHSNSSFFAHCQILAGASSCCPCRFLFMFIVTLRFCCFLGFCFISLGL